MLLQLVAFVLWQEPPQDVSPLPRGTTTSLVSPLHPRDASSIPYLLDVIDQDTLDRRMPRTTPDVVRDVRGVSAQRSGWGDASPIIRGLTGSRTLFLIDGIRLNTGIWRDRPTPSLMTFDPLALDQLELIRGPAGAPSGAEALGGTFYAHTRTPTRFPDAFELRMRTHYRYGSAEDSSTIRQEVSALSSSSALYTGATYRDSNDVSAGRELGTLPGTAYDHLDADGKVIFKLDNALLTLGLQFDRQFDVPLTYRTTASKSWRETTVGTDHEYETSRERDLIYLQIRWQDLGGWIDDLMMSGSYHRQMEEVQRVNSSGTNIERLGEVRSGGTFVNASKRTAIGRFSFGGEIYADVVNTTGSDGTVKYDRGEVADDSVYDIGGLYVQDELTLGKKVDLILGVRGIWTRIHAGDADATAFGGPSVDKFEENWFALVGHARGLYHWTDELKIIAGIHQGYRAPNLDDTTAVREVSSSVTEFPNSDLDPERFLHSELGLRLEYPSLKVGLVGFYTLLNEFIRLERNTSISSTAFTKQNADDGYLYGAELYGEYRIVTTWKFWAGLAWTIGTLEDDGEREPISMMTPASGHVGIRWTPMGATTYIEGLISSARAQKRLSPLDELDSARIPPDGTPGYTVFTIRGGMEVMTNVRTSLAVENITHKEHRVHGSGMNEPGTNFVFGVDVQF